MFSGATIFHDASLFKLGEMTGDARLAHPEDLLELGDGVVTTAMFDHRPVLDRYPVPADLSGLRCLDVGTMDGYLEAMRMLSEPGQEAAASRSGQL